MFNMSCYNSADDVFWATTTKEIKIDQELVKMRTAKAAALDAVNVFYISDGTDWINLSDNQEIEYFKISTTIGANTTLAIVDATGRKLYHGDRVEVGAVLTITAGLTDSENYNLTTFTVDTATKTSPATATVAADVAIVTAATGDAYKLLLTQGANSTITVKDAAETTYTHNADITYGTELTVTAAPATGYSLATFTINDEAAVSPAVITVEENVAVATTATINKYKVLIDAGENTTVEVKDTSETVYENGDDVEYGTVLTITVSAGDGYTLSTFTVNGTDAESPKSHTVGTADVVIVTVAAESEG